MKGQRRTLLSPPEKSVDSSEAPSSIRLGTPSPTEQADAEVLVRVLLLAARYWKALEGMWPHAAPLGPWQQHGGPEAQASDIGEEPVQMRVLVLRTLF